MRIWKEPRHWMRATMVGLVLGPTVASAEFPLKPLETAVKPLERAGRACGIGWGDGYHVCASSGVRLLADLPPKSYSATYSAKPHFKLRGIAHRIGATYYDRFDAANVHACDTPGCDAIPCDGCPSGSRDYVPGIAPLGSEVRQVPQLGPTIANPIRHTPPTVKAPTLDAPTATSPIADPAVELTQPLTHTPPAKKYPTRPRPPVHLESSVAIPVASKRTALQMLGSQNGVAVNKAQTVTQPVATQSLSSATPDSINPVHPGKPPSTPARLKPTRTPALTLTPNITVRPPTQPDPPTTEPPAVAAESPAVAAESPAVAASVSPSPPAYVPSYALAPYVAPEPEYPANPASEPGYATIQPPEPEHATIQPPEPEHATMPAPASEYVNTPAPDYVTRPEPPTSHPVRLGGKTTPSETPQGSVAVGKRPTRLGGDWEGATLSPFPTRPIVELAERSDAASQAVIFQPGSSSFK